MKYVTGYSENMPFQDEYFDVVSSFNSLDHVDDIEKTSNEIRRVLKKDGILLLLTDVGHEPTPMEPQAIEWDIIEVFKPHFLVEIEKHYEKVNLRRIYESARKSVPYDHDNPEKRYGVLMAKMKKK